MNKKSKLKIGLLIDPLRRLSDWEIKIFYEIIFSNFAEITCIFYDSTSRKKQKTFFEKLIFNFKNNTIYTSILRNFIELVENKHSNFKRFDELKVVKNFFLKSEKIEINCVKKKFDDYFDKTQCDLIRSKNLDILFRRDFRILKGDILNCAKFGVWSFHHGDNDYFRGLPPGFWECYFNESVTGVTLQKLNNDLDAGESFADTTFFVDNLGNKWLFTNKSTDKFDDHNSELYIYKVQDNNFENIEPHKCNPVITNSKTARNAGKIFYNPYGYLIRPSQMNISNIYGYALNINKIVKLNIDEYVEEKLFTIKPEKLNGARGVHHISQEKDFFILDACYHKR